MQTGDVASTPPNGEETETDDLSRLLQERERIDRQLLDHHSRYVAVLFTDIVGSTAVFEAKGDIEGLRRVHAHNRALFPLIDEHRGRVIKTIGDAIMAVFDDAGDGAQCALQMQRALVRMGAGESDPIEIRAGLHAGTVLVDGDDVFGDTVNTAARVASHAGTGEVWVTESLLADVDDATFVVVENEALNFKGKSEPVPCARLRVDVAMEEARPTTTNELLVVEIAQGRTGLRVAVLDGAKAKGTVKEHAEQPATDAQLHEVTAHFRALAHGGGESDAYLAELHARGQELSALALGDRARSVIETSDVGHLRLHIDDTLVGVPWELCAVDGGFLGHQFAMGRVVSAANTRVSRRDELQDDAPIVVVGNPTGDLPAASREGTLVGALAS